MFELMPRLSPIMSVRLDFIRVHSSSLSKYVPSNPPLASDRSVMLVFGKYNVLKYRGPIPIIAVSGTRAIF